MNSANYLTWARECIEEAERSQDEARKKTLLDIAKLYQETALNMDASNAYPASAGLASSL